MEIEFKNVVGNEKTVSPIDKKAFHAFINNMPMPFGVQDVPTNWQAPEGYTLEKFKLEDVDVEHLKKTGEKSEKIFFYLHGGGYVASLNDSCRETAYRYSQTFEHSEVYSVNYHIAPAAKHPTALNESVMVYKWLLEQGYKSENIIICGESAGGGLILGVVHYLKDHGIPLPKGIIAISPWTDLHGDSPSITLNYKNDLILGEGTPEWLYQEALHSTYGDGCDLNDPYLSPIFGDFSGFPSMLIQAGTYEVLYDDSVRLANKAEAADVDVKLTSYYGMSHCFQETFYDLPEAIAAWEEIKEFVVKCFA